MDFTPDEMSGFERAALRPYLHLKTFMKRETWSYNSKTECYTRFAESADKNRACGLMCLQFRSGVVVFKAEFWECYEGEGLAGLDERWDVGTAFFPSGVNEDIISDVLGYASASERLMAQPGEFIPALHVLEAEFKKFIKSHEKPFPEPQEESSKRSAEVTVQAIIEAASD